MGYEESISALREKISVVDKQMVALFEQRMKIIDEVAMLKKQYGKDVLDAKREDAVIEYAVSQLKDKNLGDAATELFHAIMDISKKNRASSNAV